MNKDAPINTIIALFFNPKTATGAVFALAKLSVMLGFTLYLVFAVVVIRQVSLMTRTVDTPISPLLKIIGWAHLGIAILVWFFAFTVL